MEILATDSIDLTSIKSVNDKAIEAAKTATDYMKFEAGTGLVVSKNAKSSEGASTVLTDNSLQIRKDGKKER